MNMIIKNSVTGKNCGRNIWAAVVAALAMLAAGTAGDAQPAGDPAGQNLQEIVRLTQAHMADDVIVSYIKGSGKTYTLSADALLYLDRQGVSQTVLNAMLGNPPPAAPGLAPAPPAVAMTAPPETPTMGYFQAHLTPYGQWIDVPGAGAAWVPAEANNLAWRPYMNAGHWQFTDAGWFWQSDYTWGDMAFHYGRWVNNEFTGGRWAWVPGYDWAPSWVSWREGAGGLGWAPLPFGVEFRAGLGLYWHGALVVDGVGFGLGFDSYVFVGSDHFWGGDYNRYAFDRGRAREFYDHSQFHAGYRMEGGHLMAEGLGREHISEITHHEVVEHKVVEMRRAEQTHDFAIRTAEHKELTRAPERGREPGRPEASRSPEAREHTTAATQERTGATSAHPVSATAAGTHPGAVNERGATTHAPVAHTTAPANAVNTHPGANNERGATTHSPEAHTTAPANAANTHPGTTAPNSKLPATKPKPKPANTNEPPSAPK
jgi:hypothetical protein